MWWQAKERPELSFTWGGESFYGHPRDPSIFIHYHQESEVYQLLERDVREITSLVREDHLDTRIYEAALVAVISVRELAKKDNLDTIVEREPIQMERRDIWTRLRFVKLEISCKPSPVAFKNTEVNGFIENLPVRREKDLI